MDQAVVEAAVEKRLAAVGSIIETWRRAVEAKELEITSLAAKIDELEASAANHAENPGRTGTTNSRRGSQRRSARFATPRTSSPPRCSRRRIQPRTSRPSPRRRGCLCASPPTPRWPRLAYLAKRADVHESETRELVEARTKATRGDARAAMAKADARLAELARALKGER